MLRSCLVRAAFPATLLAIGLALVRPPVPPPGPADSEEVAEADRLEDEWRLTADRLAHTRALVRELVGGRAELSSAAYRLADEATASHRLVAGLRFCFPAPSLIESQAQSLIHAVYVELADVRGEPAGAAAAVARLRGEYRAAFGADPPAWVGTGRHGPG